MPYATQQDLIDRYTEEVVLLASDHDGNGLIDSTVVDKAIADASADIDSAVAVKYDIPLPSVSAMLVRLCADIAMYRMMSDRDIAREEHRTRYDDAMKTLDKISTGARRLDLPEQPESSNGVIDVSSQPRRFGRGTLL